MVGVLVGAGGGGGLGGADFCWSFFG